VLLEGAWIGAYGYCNVSPGRPECGTPG
jgi:hypothetical protein